MATLPTPEACGRRVLCVFDKFHVRPGDGLMLQNLLCVWFDDGEWTGNDLQSGIDFALDQGWIERTAQRKHWYILTEEGYSIL